MSLHDSKKSIDRSLCSMESVRLTVPPKIHLWVWNQKYAFLLDIHIRFSVILRKQHGKAEWWRYVDVYIETTRWKILAQEVLQHSLGTKQMGQNLTKNELQNQEGLRIYIGYTKTSKTHYSSSIIAETQLTVMHTCTIFSAWKLGNCFKNSVGQPNNLKQNRANLGRIRMLILRDRRHNALTFHRGQSLISSQGLGPSN